MEREAALPPAERDLPPRNASPTRLARAAIALAGDETLIQGIWKTVLYQCHQRNSVDPLYRFVTAALTEFFENCTAGALDIIGLDNPAILPITERLKDYHTEIEDDVLDLESGHGSNEKVLEYVLRVILTDYRLYSPDTPTTPLDQVSRIARLNLAKLCRHLDLNHLLPTASPSVIRQEFFLGPTPLPDAVRSQGAWLPLQRVRLEQILAEEHINFVVYTSAFGFSKSIVLPTFTVVVESTAIVQSSGLMRKIQDSFDPFSHPTAQIRFSEGAFVEAGKVFYYPRVPIASSISVLTPSVDEFRTGTLGCYFVSPSNGDVMAVTAGHVLSSSADGIVSAPAEMPYVEAIGTINRRVEQEERWPSKEGSKWLGMQKKLQDYDRRLGTVLLDDICNVGADRVDLGLILVDKSRCGDNRLRKVRCYSDEYTFSGDGDALRLPSDNYKVGDSVVKAGIQTGLTCGSIMDRVTISWDLPAGNIKCSCHAIMGTDDEGMGTSFSERGDSGSAVVRLIRRDDEVTDSTIVRSEVVGIVYGIVQETGGPFVTTFMPIADIISRVKERLDLDINLEGVVDRPEESWDYEVLGKGKSRYDFK